MHVFAIVQAESTPCNMTLWFTISMDVLETDTCLMTVTCYTITRARAHSKHGTLVSSFHKI